MTKKKTVFLLLVFTMLVTFTITVAASSTGALNGLFGIMNIEVQKQTSADISAINGLVVDTAEGVIDSVLANEIQRAKSELSIYYDQQMQNIVNNPALNEVTNPIIEYASTLINYEKNKIDTKITEALNNWKATQLGN